MRKNHDGIQKRKYEENSRRRRSSGLLCLMLILTVISTVCASGDDNYTEIFDPDRKGSITVIKLLEDGMDGAVEVGTGQEVANSREGMQGIAFSVRKIADPDTGFMTDSSGERVNLLIYTNPDAEFLSVYQEVTGKDLESEALQISGKKGYRAETLEKAMQAIRQSGGDGKTWTGTEKLEKFAARGTKMPLTDRYGKSSIAGLAPGMYLIAEDEASSQYENPDGRVLAGTCSPFLAALPMTNQAAVGNHPAGSVWQYDITVYPKNNTTVVRKYTVLQSDGDTLKTRDSSEIGEKFTQVMVGDAPVVASADPDGKVYRKYELRDEMTAGMSFDGVKSVRIGRYPASSSYLSDYDGFDVFAESDYKTEVSEDGLRFSVRLTDSGLEKLNSFGADASVAVIFESHLNENAEIADTEEAQNLNAPSLSWRLNSSLEKETEGAPVLHYTYALELKKTGLPNPEQSAFSVKNGEGDTLLFTKEDDGIWHVRIPGESDEGSERISPDADGILMIRGLDAETYTLTETTTQSGYSLLKSSFQVTLTEPEVPDGCLKTAEAFTDGRKVGLVIKNSGRSGIAEITVENQKQIQLKTGAEGNRGILVAGLSVLCGVALYGAILFWQKKRDER